MWHTACREALACEAHYFCRESRFSARLVLTTSSPTVEPMVRATSVRRSPVTGGADDLAAGALAGAALALAVRLRLFFAAGRFTARFFLAVGSLLFSSGIRLSRSLPRS